MKQCAGDSLFVWNSQTMRVSVFSPSGSFARRFPVTAFRVACARTRFVAAMHEPNASAWGRANGGPVVTSITLHDLAGESIAEIPDLPCGELGAFAPNTSIAVRDEEVYVGTGAAPSVEVYDRHGRLLRRVTYPDVPRPTSAAANERAVDALLDGLRRIGADRKRADNRAAMLAQPKREVFAPYSEITVAPNGIVWLLTSHIGAPVAHLKAIRDAGTVVGDSDLPIGGEVRLLEAGDDYVLLSYVKDDGVAKVGAFRMRATAP